MSISFNSETKTKNNLLCIQQFYHGLNLRKVESYRHPESSNLIALSYQSNKYLYVSLTKQ